MCDRYHKTQLLCWLPAVLLPVGNLTAAALSADPGEASLAWVFGALAEELFFRLFLLRGILLPRLKPLRAVLFSSVLFAGMHLFNLRAGAGLTAILVQMLCAFAFSLWAGAVVCKTGQIAIPLLAHLLLNATAFSENLWVGFLVSAAVLAIGAALMRDEKEGEQKKRGPKIEPQRQGCGIKI